MALPPIGQEARDGEDDPVYYTARLVEEASEAAKPYLTFVDLNCQVYSYGDTQERDYDALYVPTIQNEVIVAVNVQTKEPPSVSFEPMETGEPPTWYAAIPEHRINEWLAPLTMPAPMMDPTTGQVFQPPPPPPGAYISPGNLGIDAASGMAMDPLP
jgi:hypothetical protein